MANSITLLSIIAAGFLVCVLYTLLSVKYYFDFGEKLPWWKFTDRGKQLLKVHSEGELT